MAARDLAEAHWNKTPLCTPEEVRYTTYPWLYEAAEFTKHAGEQVLEIGCGAGCDLLQFARHGSIATGIDITDQHIETARARVKDLAKIMKADARKLPFADNSFDYVYSHGVIHHSEEPKAICAEILRVLRPGGTFTIHVYAKWSYVPIRYWLQYRKAWKEHIENSTDPVHIQLYTVRTLRRLLTVPLKVRRYQFTHCQFLGRYLGWYLEAKGCKT